MKSRIIPISFFSFVATIVFYATSVHTSVALHDQLDKKADLIIFSYDRPMQLYALLESVEQYMHNVDTMHVVYRCSNDEYKKAYDQLWQDFPKVFRYCQSHQPELDFKPLTLCALNACKQDYIVFAVDDIMLKDAVNCTECIELMETYGAYGFFLRTGKNLDSCYSMSRPQPLPQFILDDGTICLWRFAQGIWDWNYPHTVDMTIYRKKMVVDDLTALAFRHPTELEGMWSSNAWKVSNQIGICFAESKIVNLPLNVVQHVLNNRHMHFMTCAELLDLFNQGKKIDISCVYRIDNKAAHMEYEPRFIER